MEILKVLGPSLITLLGIIIGWFLKDKSEKFRLQKESLLSTKRENYIKILTPFIRVLTGVKNNNELEVAIKEIQSFDYKQTAFNLMIFGSDSVTNSYNNLFQYLYQNQNATDHTPLLILFGKLLLEIRKEFGNKKTNLKELDMLKFLITDIDKLIK
ncbi:MAG: hypothetical protein HZB41_12950 [Ignavibacteriae bacterium]|nr:hypothetical protein [Ignavibacteriota bacterium]